MLSVRLWNRTDELSHHRRQPLVRQRQPGREVHRLDGWVLWGQAAIGLSDAVQQGSDVQAVVAPPLRITARTAGEV